MEGAGWTLHNKKQQQQQRWTPLHMSQVKFHPI